MIPPSLFHSHSPVTYPCTSTLLQRRQHLPSQSCALWLGSHTHPHGHLPRRSHWRWQWWSFPCKLHFADNEVDLDGADGGVIPAGMDRFRSITVRRHYYTSPSYTHSVSINVIGLNILQTKRIHDYVKHNGYMKYLAWHTSTRSSSNCEANKIQPPWYTSQQWECSKWLPLKTFHLTRESQSNTTKDPLMA